MEDQNQAAAPAAADAPVETVEVVAKASDAVGDPMLDVGDPDLVDVRESELEEQVQQPTLRERFITLGETVYYGDGTGQVWPAMIVHVYGRAPDGDEDRTDTYVDLQVFKRKQICDVEKVAQHSLALDIAAPLTGWVFKA